MRRLQRNIPFYNWNSSREFAGATDVELPSLMFSQKFTRQLSSGELMREITKHNYEGEEGGVERGEGGKQGSKGQLRLSLGFCISSPSPR